MAEDTPKFDARLAEGVAYFEQMLQLMPEDRTTLEFLAVAYGQMGETEKEEKTIVALTRVLIKERDLAALEGLLPRLEKCDLPEAKMQVLRIKTMVAPAPDLTPEAPKDLTEEERIIRGCKDAVRAEKALVKQLVEGQVLAEADAEILRENIEATPFDGRIFLISALSILEKENLPRFEKCAAFLADKFNVPPIPLVAFDPPRKLMDRFSSVTIRLRGAIPFAELGKATLVAVMNPADERLRAEFNAVTPCRFYLADPSAIEAVIAKVFKPKEEVRG